MSQRTPALLRIEQLSLGFANADHGVIKVVEDLNVHVQAGQTLAIVGESGCGKSVTAMSVLQLTPARALRGRIEFDQRDLLQLDADAMRKVCGGEIGYIFQEPMTSLNPVLSIGQQIMEPLMQHRRLDRRSARREAIRLLEMVNIPSPQLRISEYPHQLSGGMRQRVMIAMAISCHPKLLIADEPTTALDVTVQAQILELLRRLQRELNMAIVLITHDMGVVAEFSDHVAVMYAGRIVESASTAELFKSPRHPYTQALLASVPPVDGQVERLVSLPGMVPSPQHMPAGCRFAARCSVRRASCSQLQPATVTLPSGAQVACVLASELTETTEAQA